MNKPELYNRVTELSGLSKKDATSAVDAVFDVIAESLAEGQPVKLAGFGNFETRQRSARKGRNPQSGAEVQIPAHRVAAWKPSKSLKASVN
jgi:DNA-binding protein HU-beta